MANNNVTEDFYLDFLSELGLYDVRQVADAADVHYTTLNNWLSGRTIYPRLATILKVAPAIGLRVVLEREGAALRAVA